MTHLAVKTAKAVKLATVKLINLSEWLSSLDRY